MADSEVRYLLRHPNDAGRMVSAIYTRAGVVDMFGGDTSDADALLGCANGGWWYDVQKLGTVEALQVDRGWVRAEPGWTSGGYPVRVHVTGPDDWTADHVTYPMGYDSLCVVSANFAGEAYEAITTRHRVVADVLGAMRVATREGGAK